MQSFLLMIGNKTIGIIGGGQLGRMLIQAGINYPINFHVYTESGIFSSKGLCDSYTIGDLNDYTKIIEFGQDCDVITIEIENVNVDALKYLQKCGKKVYPDPSIIEMVKDRRLQKKFLVDTNINTMGYTYYSNSSDLVNIKQCVNKLCVGGYDGYGTKIVDKVDDLFPQNAILEDFCDIKRELAVIVARDVFGNITIFPITESVFTPNNMIDYLICPAQNVNIELVNNIAKKIVKKLNLVGIIAIELFEDINGEIIVNELAPRPHNTGHYSQDLLDYSQFDILIKCLLELHIPSELKILHLFGATINILGNDCSDGYPNYSIPKIGLYPHFYAKTNRSSRKLGHVNIVDNNFKSLLDKIVVLKTELYITGSTDRQQVDVGVIMGSSSDLLVMEECVNILKEFNINYEIKIVSAHRTPELMLEYAKSARRRGLKVIIAGAGGAAHLPGMVASSTTLPVIGVPIRSSNSIDGWDSILSILQMPNGIPVATVNLNGAKNAGLLACRILGKNIEMQNYQDQLKELVYDMNKNLDY